MKNIIKKFGIAAMVAIIVFSMAGCPTGSESNTPTPIPSPKSAITALTGLTENGETIEIINTTANPGRVAITASGWNSGDSYKLFVNGVEKSAGTVTVSDGQITAFNKTSGEAVEFTSTTELKVGSTTYKSSSAYSAPPDDEYLIFIFNNPGSKEGSDFINSLAGMSADQAFDAILKNNIEHTKEWEKYKKDNPYDWGGFNTTHPFVSFDDTGTGYVRGEKWEHLRGLLEQVPVPISVLAQTANPLNNAVSACVSYKNSSGNMSMFVISRSRAMYYKYQNFIKEWLDLSGATPYER